ncbi:signal peptidase I [Dysgonomonas hofstadii]|nr:signal peptidase I [Dysgonomonas hofstadii]
MGKVTLVTLLIVLSIRCFLIESFTVSSLQMESTLSENDKVLIDKTAYGIRLPVTVLDIPFTFDNIFGFKSYSSALQFPYKRLFGDEAGRNDVILLNHPLETQKPLDKRSLILSRIVGLPGDSIEIRGEDININGQGYLASPSVVERYKVKLPAGYNLEHIIEEQDIRVYEQRIEKDTLVLSLNRYDAFVLKEMLPDTIRLIPFSLDSVQVYKFRIPERGKSVDLTDDNFVYYRQIISLEHNKENVVFEEGVLVIDGIKHGGAYTFGDDYYWVLSDNTENALDSRYLGFIPFKNIIGKVRFIWYSKEKDHCFSKVE